VINRFDEIASLWDENPKRVEMALHFAKEIESNIELKPTDKLLDYGCGSGTCAVALSQKVSKIIGVDSSKKMLELFEKKCRDTGVSDFLTISHDLDDSSLEDIEQVDVIISTMALHHTKNPKEVLQRLRLLLKSGGRIGLIDLEEEDGTFHDHGNDGVMHFGFDVERLQGVIREVGFCDVTYKRIKTINKNDREYHIFLICAELSEA